MVPLDTVCWTQGYLNDRYAAVELAQGKVNGPLTEAQMRSLAWYLRHVFFPAYPSLAPSPTTLPYHSEIQQGISEGKSDLFVRRDPAGIAWRNKLIELVKGG